MLKLKIFSADADFKSPRMHARCALQPQVQRNTLKTTWHAHAMQACAAPASALHVCMCIASALRTNDGACTQRASAIGAMTKTENSDV